MTQYGLIPEEYITPDLAIQFPIVSNFSFNFVFESNVVTDASGQQFETLNKWVTLRWVESGDSGFTPEQIAAITASKAKFNTDHPSIQIGFDVIGDAAWAQAFHAPPAEPL